MLRLSYYIINIFFIILYLYPGSVFGYILYNDYSKQPQLVNYLIFSTNHFLAFMSLSLYGFFCLRKETNILIFYLLFISIILEFFHLLIPKRSFEFSDLFGNFFGVLLSVLIYYLFIILKNEFIRRQKKKF